VLRALEVNIRITKRTLILHITANTNGKDGTAFLEGVVDVGLTYILTEITDIEGTIGIGGRSGNDSRLFRSHV